MKLVRRAYLIPYYSCVIHSYTFLISIFLYAVIVVICFATVTSYDLLSKLLFFLRYYELIHMICRHRHTNYFTYRFQGMYM